MPVSVTESVPSRVGGRSLAAAVTWSRLAAPLAVFAIALYLRLDRIWLAQFKLDEAALAGRALSLVEGRSLPLAGNPSASGVLNPPNFVYLLALPHAIYHHPIAGSVFLALLGALAAPGLYLLVERAFDRTIALFASLLLAVNPWAVWHSRTIWEPNSVHFFVILFAIALFAFVLDGSPRALAISVVTLAFLPTLHLSTVVLVPLWLLGLALRRDRLRWRPVLLGLAASSVLYIPYLYGEYTRGWISFRVLFAQPAGQSRIDGDALGLVTQLVSGFDYFAPAVATGDVVGSVLAVALRYGELGLCLVGLLALARTAARGRRRERSASWLVLAWIAIPIAMSTSHWLALHVHYFLTVLPALTIAAAIGAATLARLRFRLASGRRGARELAPGERRAAPSSGRIATIAIAIIIGTLVAVVAVSQALSLVSVNDDVAAGRRGRYFYGVPIRLTTDLAQYLMARGVSEAIVVSPSPDLASEVQVLTRDRVTTTGVDGRRSILLPGQSGSAYVVEEDGSRAAAYAARVFGPWLSRTIDEPGLTIYSVYEVAASGRSSDLGEATPIDARFANGLRAIDATYPTVVTPGDTLTLATHWATTGRARLADGADQRTVAFAILASEAVPSLVQAHDYDHAPSAATEAGEWINWLDLRVPIDAPTGLYYIDTGLYRADGFARQQVVDAAGKPIDDQVRLGPIRVAPPLGSPVAPPAIMARATLGDAISLSGYGLSRPNPNELVVTLFWTALRQPPTDYQAFVHLTDRAGKPFEQSDSMPGRIPTSLWRAGETIRDEHRVSIPPGLGTGQYDIRIGLYYLNGGKRLPVSEADRPTTDQAIVLETIALP